VGLLDRDFCEAGRGAKLPFVTTSARALVTEREFLSLPESMRPAELVDGEVILAPSPSFWHQEVLSRLVVMLRAWAATSPSPITVVQAPFDVRFAAGRILQPDAMVFLAALARDVGTPLDRIPELCIEVLSSNRAYDRVTKRFIYAEAGVAEYWIVDPAGVVERRTGPGLIRAEEIDDWLTSELLPGFQLSVSELLGSA
jgi:Uma2 family endonuclease